MRLPFVILLSSCALVLAGCAGMPAITTSNTDSIPGTALHGSVHGGQNPIAGAHVYLYAINTTGYGGPGIAPSSTNASCFVAPQRHRNHRGRQRPLLRHHRPIRQLHHHQRLLLPQQLSPYLLLCRQAAIPVWARA